MTNLSITSFNIAGEVYAGSTPVLKNSLQRGWLFKWTVFAYQILVYSIPFFLIIIAIILPVSFDQNDEMEDGHIIFYAFIMFLAMGIFTVLLVIINSLLVVSIPIMIIENKSPLEAIKRSITLCQGFTCFILCTVFCWSVARTIAMAMLISVLEQLLAFISGIGQLFINVFIISTTPM